jgi:hypothetical protein
MMASKIGDLEFHDFSAEDQALVMEVMTSMKKTLDEAIPRAMENRNKPM